MHHLVVLSHAGSLSCVLQCSCLCIADLTKKRHFAGLNRDRSLHLQVWWEDLDSQNRPILMVRLGRALNECKSRAEADTVAETIVSQVSLLLSTECICSEALNTMFQCLRIIHLRQLVIMKARMCLRPVSW